MGAGPRPLRGLLVHPSEFANCLSPGVHQLETFMWDVGGHVVRIPRGSPPHGQVCGALGASLAIVDCSIGDAEPTVHGRSDVHPTWPDLLKEQEPGAAALHSKSAGHQSGMAQRVQKKSAHLDWSHVRGGASGGGDQAHGPLRRRSRRFERFWRAGRRREW